MISHSKIITPAFHFKILEEFCLIFDSHSDALLNNLKKHENGDVFDVTNYISLMALDVVCGKIQCCNFIVLVFIVLSPKKKLRWESK